MSDSQIHDQLRFLGALAPSSIPLNEADAAIVGVAYDGAVSYRSGAKDGPTALRMASNSIESYCPLLDMDLDTMRYVDLGNLDLQSLQDCPQKLMDHLQSQLDRWPTAKELPMIGIGGDHLVAYPFVVRALRDFSNLQILHIDAHGDLRQDWEGQAFNHSTILRRVLDILPENASIHRWGIRSGTKEEFTLARNHPRIETAPNTLAGGLDLIDRMLKNGRPIYLTLDVDGINPADIPGTGTPEPGGLSFFDVETVLDQIARDIVKSESCFVGADIVELAPSLDPSGRSQVAAARLLRTILLLVQASTRSASYGTNP